MSRIKHSTRKPSSKGDALCVDHYRGASVVLRAVVAVSPVALRNAVLPRDEFFADLDRRNEAALNRLVFSEARKKLNGLRTFAVGSSLDGPEFRDFLAAIQTVESAFKL